MKIEEFFKLDNDNQVPFNAEEDLVVFMRNDPLFYRKHYFPTMAKMSDLHDQGKKIDPKIMMQSVINKGIDSYCQKFKIKQNPSELFPESERSSVIDKIYSEELPQIKNGSYRLKK